MSRGWSNPPLDPYREETVCRTTIVHLPVNRSALHMRRHSPSCGGGAEPAHSLPHPRRTKGGHFLLLPESDARTRLPSQLTQETETQHKLTRNMLKINAINTQNEDTKKAKTKQTYSKSKYSKQQGSSQTHYKVNTSKTSSSMRRLIQWRAGHYPTGPKGKCPQEPANGKVYKIIQSGPAMSWTAGAPGKGIRIQFLQISTLAAWFLNRVYNQTAMEVELKYGYRVDDIEQESQPETWPSLQRIQCRAVILAVII